MSAVPVPPFAEKHPKKITKNAKKKRAQKTLCERVPRPTSSPSGCLAASAAHRPGCRDEKKLDGYVVYVYEHQASSTEKKLDQVLLITD
jgi:hypothetical protein